MRVIIAGGRDFDDYNHLKLKCIDRFQHLKNLGYNTARESLEIVSGTARGADKLGEQFGKEFDIQIKYFPADWSQFGKSAGYIRNDQMAKYAKEDKEVGVLFVFWDGKSRGTKHMIDLAKKRGLVVEVIKY